MEGHTVNGSVWWEWRRVRNGINRYVLLSDCGAGPAGHYFLLSLRSSFIRYISVSTKNVWIVRSFFEQNRTSARNRPLLLRITIWCVEWADEWNNWKICEIKFWRFCSVKPPIERTRATTYVPWNSCALFHTVIKMVADWLKDWMQN